MDDVVPLTISKEDVESLGVKLTGLPLKDEEGALLWAVFALAADVVDPATGGVGHTDLVRSSADDGDLTVELDCDYRNLIEDIKPNVAERMAAAFSPGRAAPLAADGRPDPRPQERKILGRQSAKVFVPQDESLPESRQYSE
jgi:hypothetical protein